MDGTDFLASYRAMREAVPYCREGHGPALVHAHVIRPYSHSLSDDERLYRTAAEREAESARDPVLLFPKFLIEEGVIDRRMLQNITHEIDEEVQQATAAGPARRAAGRGIRAGASLLGDGGSDLRVHSQWSRTSTARR